MYMFARIMACSYAFVLRVEGSPTIECGGDGQESYRRGHLTLSVYVCFSVSHCSIVSAPMQMLAQIYTRKGLAFLTQLF